MPRFFAALPEGALVAGDERALEQQLRDYIIEAAASWPGLDSMSDAFVAYVAARSAQGIPPIAHAAELFLAHGCAMRWPASQAAFHRGYREVVKRVLTRRGAEAHSADDVTQVVFTQLLVAPQGELPKIVQYRGQGPLKSWVAAAASTALAMLRRGQQRKREDKEDLERVQVDALVDPELGYLKERYKGEVQRAIAQALARLDERERTLLRLSAGAQMNIDELGAMYRVSRATAARWLVAARGALLEHTRAVLRSELGLSDTELRSIVGLIHSQLDISIVRLLS